MKFWKWLFGEEEPVKPREPVTKTLACNRLIATIHYENNGSNVEDVQIFEAEPWYFVNDILIHDGPARFTEWLENGRKCQFLELKSSVSNFKKLIPVNKINKITTDTESYHLSFKI